VSYSLNRIHLQSGACAETALRYSRKFSSSMSAPGHRKRLGAFHVRDQVSGPGDSFLRLVYAAVPDPIRSASSFSARFAETPPAARLDRARSRKATGERSSPVREPKWSQRAREGQEPAPRRQALLNRPRVQQSVVDRTGAIRCLGAAQATLARL
jgi:hypothetical protein